MQGRRLLITSKTARRVVNRQVYGLEGSGCSVASARPLGVIARKLQLNHLRKIGFFLGINIEVNERERLWDSKFKTKKWDQVSLDHVKGVFVLPSTTILCTRNLTNRPEDCCILRRKSRCVGIVLIMETVFHHAMRFTQPRNNSSGLESTRCQPATQQQVRLGLVLSFQSASYHPSPGMAKRNIVGMALRVVEVLSKPFKFPPPSGLRSRLRSTIDGETSW